MKVQLASDLHLEFLEMKFQNERLIAPAADADVLVLAGDIATGNHPRSMHPQYTGDPLNGSFVSHLSELLKESTLWLHRHVHNSFDYTVEGCRVMANSLGYPANPRSADAVCDLTFEKGARAVRDVPRPATSARAPL
jgi:hypothetical protein